MQLYMILVLSMLYHHTTATPLQSFFKHLYRRTGPVVKCFQCYHGSLAGVISQQFGPLSNEGCFEPDESVPSVECTGRCTTMVIEGKGVDVNIFRTCILPSSYASSYANDVSSVKVEGTLVVDNLASLLKEYIVRADVERAYLSKLQTGSVSVNMAYCDATELPTACDPPFRYPNTDVPAVLSPPTECASCYQGDLARQFFTYQSQEDFLVSVMNEQLPHGDDDQCSASTDDKDCSDNKCLGLVLDAAGVESTIMKVCLPVSSMAAIYLGQYNPLSDVTVQGSFIKDFKDTDIRSLMERMKSTPLGTSILAYADQISAGKISLKIVSIN